MKSNADKIVDAMVEITKKPQKGIFEVLDICLKHFGDNVKAIELKGKKKLKTKAKNESS